MIYPWCIAVCSVKGVFTSFDISPASVDDIHYLKEIKHEMKDCSIIADKGYLSAAYQLDLFTSSNINLEVPMRNNQRDLKRYPYYIQKVQKTYRDTIFTIM